MKIFLAEDNEDNYLVVKSNLRKLKTPIELIWAQDGQIAMDMLAHEEKIDLFLIDIEMPFINGIELTKWIREQERFAKATIIAVTASVFAEMKKMYLEKGFDFILEKPFFREDFLQMLEKNVGLS